MNQGCTHAGSFQLFRTFHVLNLMQMISNEDLRLTLGSAHEKFDVSELGLMQTEHNLQLHSSTFHANAFVCTKNENSRPRYMSKYVFLFTMHHERFPTLRQAARMLMYVRCGFHIKSNQSSKESRL